MKHPNRFSEITSAVYISNFLLVLSFIFALTRHELHNWFWLFVAAYTISNLCMILPVILKTLKNKPLGLRKAIVSFGILIYATTTIFLALSLLGIVPEITKGPLSIFLFTTGFSTALYCFLGHYLHILLPNFTLEASTVRSNSTLASMEVAVFADLHFPAVAAIENHQYTKALATRQLQSYLLSTLNQRYILSLGDSSDRSARVEFEDMAMTVNTMSAGRRVLFVPGNHELTLNLNLNEKGDMHYNFFNKIIQPFHLDDLVLDENLLRVRSVHAKYLGLPKRKYPALMGEIYPMVLLDKNEFLLLGLNSCSEYGLDMLTSGMGRISQRQIRRLKYAQKFSAPGKKLVLAMHHHVGVTPEAYLRILTHNATNVRTVFKNWIQLKGLKLKNSREFLQAVVRLKAHFTEIYIVHGHLHCSFTGSYQGITIISHASLAEEEIAARGRV